MGSGAAPRLRVQLAAGLSKWARRGLGHGLLAPNGVGLVGSHRKLLNLFICSATSDSTAYPGRAFESPEAIRLTPGGAGEASHPFLSPPERSRTP